MRPLLLLALAASSALAQTELGPAPTDGFGGATGRISALACSSTNPNLYYAAGADGGVWRTDNAGTSWRPLTDAAPTTAIGALALHPTNDQILYAGMGEANFANHSRYGLGLLKTTNGGLTWTVLAAPTFSGRCFSRIVIDPITPSTLYAAVTHAGGFPALAAAKGHPQASGPVGILKSIDSGSTWTLLTGGLPALDATDLAIDAANPLNVYAAIGAIFGDANNGIYKSTNGGTTWTRLAGGLPTTNLGRIGLAIARTDPLRLYANFALKANADGTGASFIGAYRSIDGGATWSTISAPVDTSNYGWYFGCVGVHPNNPTVVFMGGINALFTDNGVNFQTMSGSHPDNHAVAWDAAGRMIIGCDGGVYRANGLTLTAINTGLSVTQFYAGLSTHPTNPTIVLGGLQDNGTVLRTTPTLAWAMRLGGDGGWTQLDQSNPLRMFGESQGTGALQRSENGGASWVAAGAGLSGRNCFLPPYLLDARTPGRMLYATERLWVSTNYGASWTTLSADLTGGGTAAIRSIAIAPSDSRYVYAATNDGRVLASSTFGATFTVIRTGNPGWPRTTRELCVHPTVPTTLYLAAAAFNTDQVLRTTNMGGSWQPLDAGLPDVPVNTVAVDVRSNPPTLYAGTDAGLFTSSSDGAVWRSLDIPNTAVIDIVLEPTRSRLTVGTQGRGAWSVPAPAYCTSDVDGDGDYGTDFDIQAFFACLGGTCCPTCTPADFNNDGDTGTDADIEAFFRILGGSAC